MSQITDFSQLDLKKQYTYADYLTWTFDERLELIKGWIYKMSPAPKRKHQEVSLNLTLTLASYFKKCGCKIYEAPFDVRLKKNKGSDSEINTVVQPDISVFCDLIKLDDRGAIDAPDLVVEITSDSTMKKDYNEKFNLYEENGVQEYWVVMPEANAVNQYVLQDGRYAFVDTFTKTQHISPALFPGLSIDLSLVFE